MAAAVALLAACGSSAPTSTSNVESLVSAFATKQTAKLPGLVLVESTSCVRSGGGVYDCLVKLNRGRQLSVRATCDARGCLMRPAR